MAFDERIKYFRKMRGLSLKEIGLRLGFPERSADVRMAQYENGSRTPKEDLVEALAGVLEVDPRALTVPDIYSPVGLIHTLFALEDLYGLKVKDVDGRPCLTVDLFQGSRAFELNSVLLEWKDQARKLETGEITELEYNEWRYNYNQLPR